MKRGLRIIPSSLRRRTFVVAMIALLVVVSLALTVVWHATGKGMRRAAKVVRLSEAASGRQPIGGVGCNLIGLPATNLISNGSFGPEYIHAHYFASGGSSGEFSVKVSDTLDNVPQADGYFTGASFTLFRESQNEMRKLESGSITGYEAGQVSGTRVVEPSTAIPEGVKWNAFAELNEVAVACGTEGYILRMPRDGVPECRNIGFRVDLIAIAAGASGFLAGDSTGRFYTSSDGIVWQLMPVHATAAIRTIEYIALPDFENGFFLASGAAGEVFFGHLTGLEPLSGITDNTITRFVTTDDGVVFALGLEGQVISSANGVNWESEESLTSSVGWLGGDAAGGIAFFVGTGGKMAIRHDKGSVTKIDSNNLAGALTGRFHETGSTGRWPDLTDVVVLATNRIVIRTEKGTLLYTEDQGETWEQEGPFFGEQTSNVERMRSGDIFVAHSDGKVTRAELTAKFVFEPRLAGESVESGDLIVLSLPLTRELDTTQLAEPYRQDSLTVGEWAISGGASFATKSDADTGMTGLDSGGSGALSFHLPQGSDGKEPDETYLAVKDCLFSIARGTVELTAVNNPNRSYLDARMTQKIDLSRLVVKESNPFFQLEFDAYTSGDIKGPIEIWFSGPFTNVGESVSVSQDSWEHRRLTFVFPNGLKPEDEMWINIGFSGSGTLYIDNLWFGRNGDAPQALSSLVTQEDEKGLSLPVDVVRLDCVPIGRSKYATETWALPEGRASEKTNAAKTHNLGAALQYTERLNAVPWLVIDLRVTSQEIVNLIEYLAGSPLSAYGKLRSRDGAIGRWSDAFDVIYLEITDVDDVLPNDISRANYVHWIMDQIVTAPDYHDVQNKIFLIDGMKYEDGRSHTSADYHAGDLLLDGPIREAADVEANITRWINSIPRRRTIGDRFMPELLRSVDVALLGDTVRLVDVALPLIADLGDNSAVALANVNLADEQFLSGRHAAVRALRVCRDLTGKVLLEEPDVLLSERETKEKKTAEPHDDVQSQTIYFYTYRSRGETTAIAINIGAAPEIVSIQGFNEKDASFELYDHRGIVISEGVNQPDSVNFTLLPGGVLVLRQEVNPVK
ncbi:MAG: hypothetical protein ACOX4A_00505 [Saccharofermentanales bacterium]|jgi:photosystem II stability/assembly factor-like uncharacterized protein